MVKKPTCLMPALALVFVANLLFAATFAAQPAHACSMAPPPNPPAKKERLRGVDALQKADAVFSGVVVKTVKADFTGTLEVEESWKGVSVGERVVARSSQLGADCNPAPILQEGERYLVYAHGNPDEDVPLSADPGTGTRLLSTAEADLQALGPASLAPPESVDPTPVGDTGHALPAVIVASGALLFVAALGALTFWRWRRLG